MTFAPGAGATPFQVDGTGPAAGVSVLAVSPWVQPDGEWTAQIRMAGAPPDATLAYAIHQPVRGSEPEVREALDEARNDDLPTGVLQRGDAAPLADLTDATGLTTLTIPLRSSRSGSRDRTLVPDAGVHPVVVTVRNGDRSFDRRLTLFLNRLPASAERDPFRLAVNIQPALGLSFDETGSPDVDAVSRSALASTVDLLGEAEGLDVTVALQPETLVALTESGDEGDEALVDRLRSAVEGANLLRRPWADLHAEGWATTGSFRDILTSVSDGQEALFARLLVRADATTWPVDPTVGPAAVSMLSRLGLTTLVVDPARLAETRAPADESGFSRPFRVVGAGEATIGAVSIDPALQALLAATSDPALAVNRIIALMIGEWLADDDARGSVLQVDPVADQTVAGPLLAALRDGAGQDGAGQDGAQPIRVVPPAEVAALPPITTRQSGRDVEWTRMLTEPPSIPRVGEVSSRLATARPLIDDYASIVPEGDRRAAEIAILVQRSLDQRVSPGAQVDLLTVVEQGMRDDLRRISVSDPRTLTVTSRRTTIPLRFTNDMGRPIRARLRLTSPKLSFVDGDERALTLQPGLNRVDIEVDVRASGEFSMQADLLAPGSERVLASTRQQIRSRTFSGVGLMLSGGALLFLVVWWSRTLRRRGSDGPPAPSE